MQGATYHGGNLVRRDSLLRPLAEFTATAIVATGPWLFTILALLAIGHLAGQWVGSNVLEAFRSSVIYAFGLSLLAGSAVTLVATRMLSNDLYSRKLDRIRPLFVATLVLAAASTAVLAAPVFAALADDRAMAVAGTALCVLITMVWVALSFCAAIRDYVQVSLGFCAGLILGVAGSVIGAAVSGEAAALICGFGAGLAFIFFWLMIRIMATFAPGSQTRLGELPRLVYGLKCYRWLAFGTLAAALGTWIDKWLMWASPFAVKVHGGLFQAPIYDSPMFIAYLTVIPSVALFVSQLDSKFYNAHKDYFGAIESHATLAEIERHSKALQTVTTDMLVKIMVLQGTLATAAVLWAPRVVELAGLEYQQLTVLRFGAIGAVFHFLLLATSALLLFFGQTGRFLVLQAGFALLLAVCTAASMALGQAYLGLGYLVASVIGGAAGFWVLERSLERLDYFTFIVGNAQQPAPP